MLKSGIYDFVICRGGTDMCFVLGFGRKRPDLKQYRISGLTDCPRLCLVHTLCYDRARPRPRLSDRAGVSLCKSYKIVDSMVEATCLRVWEFITHIIRLVCGQ